MIINIKDEKNKQKIKCLFLFLFFVILFAKVNKINIVMTGQLSFYHFVLRRV